MGKDQMENWKKRMGKDEMKNGENVEIGNGEELSGTL